MFKDKVISACICWILTTLIFIPKIKDMLIEKFPSIKPLIIPLRIILIFAGFILIGLTASTS